MKQETDVYSYFNKLGGEKPKSQGLDVQLVVITKDFELYRANTDNGMKDDLIKSFLQPIAYLVTTGPDKGMQIMDYDPQTKPDHDVLWKLPADEVPAFQLVQEQLEQPLDELSVYKDEDGDMDGVIAMALRVQSDHGDVVIFQRIMPNYILKKSRKLSLIFDGANFGKLESPAAFQISRDNHVFYFNEDLYVLNQSSFEYIFDYQAKKESIADVKLADIEKKYAANLMIAEGKTLVGLLAGDKHAINKLQKLDASVTLTGSALTKMKMGYDVDIKIDTGTGRMVIEEKKDVKELINILNDDYLLSDITTGKYTVHSKRKIVLKQT